MAYQEMGKQQLTAEWQPTSMGYEERLLVDGEGIQIGQEARRRDKQGIIFLFERMITNVSIDRWHYEDGSHEHTDLVTGRREFTIRGGTEAFDNKFHTNK